MGGGWLVFFLMRRRPPRSTRFPYTTSSDLSGRVKLVGFDTSDSLLEGMEKGAIAGLVSQDPFDIGYQGVKKAVASIRGEDRKSTRLNSSHKQRKSTRLNSSHNPISYAVFCLKKNNA